jgi:hypothetical protein
MKPTESQDFQGLYVVALVVVIFLAWNFIYYLQRTKKIDKEFQERMRAIRASANQQPDKARPAWELAVAQMEGYFQRNLSQVQSIFWAAVAVMSVGFLVMLFGVGMAFQQPQNLSTALVSSGAGIITQFIGATFMVIYRSTLGQAAHFMSILERINTVGMAVQVLDGIPETEVATKTALRADVSRILIGAVVETFAKGSARRSDALQGGSKGVSK